MPGEIVPHSIDHKFHVVNRLGSDGGANNQGIAIVQRKRDGRVLVRKTLCETGNPLSHPRDWLREMKLLQRLRHPNICAFIEASITPTLGRLYMEFCNYGNLSDFKNNMNQLQRGVPESFVWHVLKSLTKALCYIHLGFRNSDEVMHSRHSSVPGWEGVLHRDIKDSNVFLRPTSGPYPEIKLGDFGLAIGMNELHAQTAHAGVGMAMCPAGPPGWVPPEFPQCGERSDIFCVGAVIQYICKRSLWNEVNPEGGVSQGYSQSLDQIVRWAMQRQRECRPFAKELARMIYVQQRQVNPPFTPVPSQAYSRLLN